MICSESAAKMSDGASGSYITRTAPGIAILRCPRQLTNLLHPPRAGQRQCRSACWYVCLRMCRVCAVHTCRPPRPQALLSVGSNAPTSLRNGGRGGSWSGYLCTKGIQNDRHREDATETLFSHQLAVPCRIGVQVGRSMASGGRGPSSRQQTCELDCRA